MEQGSASALIAVALAVAGCAPPSPAPPPAAPPAAEPVPAVVGRDDPAPSGSGVRAVSPPGGEDELAWSGEDRPNLRRPPSEARLADGRISAVPVNGAPLVRRVSASGAVVWERSIAPGFGETAELAVDAARGRVFATRHSFLSSGCTLVALDLASGVMLWSLELQGIGPQDHSKYFNDVRLELRPDGSVVVFGNEAHGRYVERVDGAGGRTVGHRLFPAFRG